MVTKHKQNIAGILLTLAPNTALAHSGHGSHVDGSGFFHWVVDHGLLIALAGAAVVAWVAWRTARNNPKG